MNYLDNVEVQALAQTQLGGLSSDSLKTLDQVILSNELVGMSLREVNGFIGGQTQYSRAASTPIEKAVAFLVTTVTGLGLATVFTKEFLNEISNEKHPQLFPHITTERVLYTSAVGIGIALISLVIYYRARAIEAETSKPPVPKILPRNTRRGSVLESIAKRIM